MWCWQPPYREVWFLSQRHTAMLTPILSDPAIDIASSGEPTPTPGLCYYSTLPSLLPHPSPTPTQHRTISVLVGGEGKELLLGVWPSASHLIDMMSINSHNNHMKQDFEKQVN